MYCLMPLVNKSKVIMGRKKLIDVYMMREETFGRNQAQLGVHSPLETSGKLYDTNVSGATTHSFGPYGLAFRSEGLNALKVNMIFNQNIIAK